MFIPEDKRELQLIDNIKDKYEGYWVAIGDIEFNENNYPVKGKVWAYEKERKELKKYPISWCLEIECNSSDSIGNIINVGTLTIK